MNFFQSFWEKLINLKSFINYKFLWASSHWSILLVGAVIGFNSFRNQDRPFEILGGILGIAAGWHFLLRREDGKYPFASKVFIPGSRRVVTKIPWRKGRKKKGNDKGITELVLLLRWAQEEGCLPKFSDFSQVLNDHFELADRSEFRPDTVDDIFKTRTRPRDSSIGIYEESPGLLISRIDKNVYANMLNKMEKDGLKSTEAVLKEALTKWVGSDF